LFRLLSRPSSRDALAIAEAAIDQSNEEGIEIAHLLYGLYLKDTGPTRRTFNEARIGNDNVLLVLVLNQLDSDPVLVSGHFRGHTQDQTSLNHSRY